MLQTHDTNAKCEKKFERKLTIALKVRKQIFFFANDLKLKTDARNAVREARGENKTYDLGKKCEFVCISYAFTGAELTI